MNRRVMQRGMTANQCMAARYLHADGWTYEQLARTFEVSDETLARHLGGECDHPDLTEPMPPDGLAPGEIRAMRESAGMTQADLADALGVGPPTVSCWERGVKVPRRWRLRELRAVLRGGGDSA